MELDGKVELGADARGMGLKVHLYVNQLSFIIYLLVS